MPAVWPDEALASGVPADNARYTKRFAYCVGRRCRSATIKDIAPELRLDCDSVKELDKQYIRAQLAKASTPGPKVIGIEAALRGLLLSPLRGPDDQTWVNEFVKAAKARLRHQLLIV